MSFPGPLRVHPSGRYFTDARDRPFLWWEDSAWSLPCNLPAATAPTYFRQRQEQGYSVILMESMTHSYFAGGGGYRGNAPGNSAGQEPFVTGTDAQPYSTANARLGQQADFSTPNDAFFAHVADMADRADDRDLVVQMFFLSLGFDGAADQGWFNDVANGTNSNAVCRAFGQYMAQGHGSFGGLAGKKNLVLTIASDHGTNAPSPPSAAVIDKLEQFILGMQDGGARQLWCGNWRAPSISTTQGGTIETRFQYNPVYSYAGVPPTTAASPNGPSGPQTSFSLARIAYNYAPISLVQGSGGRLPLALPSIYQEGAYDGSTFADGSRKGLRGQHMWAFLSGCSGGVCYGSENVWRFENGVWQSNVTAATATDFARAGALFRDMPWWRLVPSELGGMHRLVTSANGTQSGVPSNYVAAAQTDDGQLLLAYVPHTGSGAQNATLDLTGMSGSSRGRWWDPSNGRTVDITGGNYSQAATSGVVFTTPGTNAGGDDDWLLILDRPATNLAPFRSGGGGVAFGRR